MTVDAVGDLYVADYYNQRVLEYNTPLTTDTVADQVFGQAGSFATRTCNLGGVSDSSLCNPFGVAVDASGNLYVTDDNNSRALEYDSPLGTPPTPVPTPSPVRAPRPSTATHRPGLVWRCRITAVPGLSAA